MLTLRVETDGTFAGTKVWEAETGKFLYLTNFNVSFDTSMTAKGQDAGIAHLIGPADRLLPVLLPHKDDAVMFAVDYDLAKGPTVDAIFKVRLEVALTAGQKADRRDLARPAGAGTDPDLLGLAPRVIREE